MSRTTSTDVLVHPLRDGDTETVHRVFAGLSLTSAYHRFGTGLTLLPPRMAAQLAAVEPGRHRVLVAELDDVHRLPVENVLGDGRLAAAARRHPAAARGVGLTSSGRAPAGSASTVRAWRSTGPSAATRPTLMPWPRSGPWPSTT